MNELTYKKTKGEWVASCNGMFIASGDTKPLCQAATIDYLLQVFNHSFNTPMTAVANDGSVFTGQQVLNDQYSIIRTDGGSSGGTGKLTREYFDKWVTDYNQAIA